MIPHPQPLEGLPVCPECGSATFWNNTDDVQTFFCINDNCKWRQQIRSRPHSSAQSKRDIRKDERDAVYLALAMMIYTALYSDEVCRGMIDFMCKSLRSKQGEP